MNSVFLTIISHIYIVYKLQNIFYYINMSNDETTRILQLIENKKNTILNSLKSLNCTICGGFGHYEGQCATLKALDKMMKAHPIYKDEWIKEKESKINVAYYKQKDERAKGMAEKLLGKKRYLKNKVSELDLMK